MGVKRFLIKDGGSRPPGPFPCYTEKAEKDTYDFPDSNATYSVPRARAHFGASLSLHDHVQRRARRVIYATAARSSRRREFI